MPDHLVDPGEEHVAAVAHFALDRSAGPGLVLLELAAKPGHFALAQRLDREVIAALAIARDLIPRSAISSWVSSDISLFDQQRNLSQK